MTNDIQPTKNTEGKPSGHSLRPLRVFMNALHGLIETFKNDFAVRYKLIALPFVIAFIFWIDKTTVEKSLLLITAFAVLIAELINSAIESVIDKVSTNYSYLAKKAKDIGSAVVILTLICTIIVWMLILN